MRRKRSPRATRKARSQKPRRRPGRDDEGVVTPAAVVALRRHRRGFVAWAERTRVHGEGTDGADLFEGVSLFLGLTAGPAGCDDPARCTPEEVEVMVDTLEHEVGETDVRPMLDAFAHLLEYLDATALWRGTSDDLDGCLAVLTEAGDSTPGALADALDAVVSDPAEQAAAVAGSPLVTQVDALLAWVRDGAGGRRSVTATGALRRSDLVEAAALVGVALPAHTSGAVPRSGADGTAQPQLAHMPALPPHPARRVRGMWDVLPLARVWRACHATDLIEEGSTTVRLGSMGERWFDGAPEERSRVRAALVVGYVLTRLTEATYAPWGALRAAALAMAMAQLAVRGPTEPDRLAADVSALALVGEADLHDLVELGVLRLDGETLSVTTGLERAVAGAVRLFLEDDDPLSDDVST